MRRRIVYLTASVCFALGAARADEKNASATATFECRRVQKDGARVPIGKAGFRIEAEWLECTVAGKDARLGGGRAVVKTTWKKGGVAHTGGERLGAPTNEGGVYEWRFSLDRGIDWDVCASEVTVPVQVFDLDDKVVFSTQRVYRQDCFPFTTPAPAVDPVVPAASAEWGEGQKALLPAEAVEVAQRFIEAVVDDDPPGLGLLAGKGIKRSGKVLRPKELHELEAATGIRPLVACDKHGRECKAWGPWRVVVKSPTELWIYSPNERGHGTFQAAVFEKTARGWAWTAIATYTTP